MFRMIRFLLIVISIYSRSYCYYNYVLCILRISWFLLNISMFHVFLFIRRVLVILYGMALLFFCNYVSCLFFSCFFACYVSSDVCFIIRCVLFCVFSFLIICFCVCVFLVLFVALCRIFSHVIIICHVTMCFHCPFFNRICYSQ